MPEPPKRPGLPVPDPNWEMELHGGAPAARKGGPESKDEMLAHALLRAEPDPLDLGDDFGELERTTLPPPEAMNDHVARMMAQAELSDRLDNDGDRPTPLFEEDGLPFLAPLTPPQPKVASLQRGALQAVPIAQRKAQKIVTPIARVEPSEPGLHETKPESDPFNLSSNPVVKELDFSDLPAVFALDGLDEPHSEPAISPSLGAPPSSEPAISHPFASLDSVRLGEVMALTNKPAVETVGSIQARFVAGDYGRALVLAESALNDHPGDPELTRFADDCREMLYERYLERLGAGDHIPRIALHSSALTGLALDHRAGFLLSCVDGGSTVEEIIDVSAMPRLDAVRILYELVQDGVIEMAAPR